MPTHDPFSGVSKGGRSLVLREGKPRAMLDRVGMRVTGGAALNLEGKLLVAMPSMGDARFEHSVVLMCSYSDKGAMGLIINKPTLDIRMSDVLDQLDISPEPKAAAMAVHYGGPVETGRGFVLHSAEYASRLNTLRVSEHFGMTATLDILEEIARGAGPAQSLMMLGYAGWGAGQLEGELARNAWLTAEADPALVFETPAARKWTRALESLGIDPVSLSSTAGRA